MYIELYYLKFLFTIFSLHIKTCKVFHIFFWSHFQHWTYHHPSYSPDYSWVFGLPVREACSCHSHWHEFLCRGFARSVSCQRRSAGTSWFPWLHVHWFGHHLWARWSCRRQKRIHYPDPHPYHAQRWSVPFYFDV